MDVRTELVSQYRAGLAMLRQCIDACPEDVWVSGKHPRTYWRIAYHAIFYTHLYLADDLESFVAWEKHRDKIPALWGDPDVEPPYSREETLAYLDFVDANVASWVQAIDIERKTSGFDWYKMSKFEHQLVNIRHLGGHMGQLSEILMAHGADVDWVGKKHS
ncbi:MAG TPA: DinB family protein [Fimbriimonadaceae bacterium]|nr:DinB family protein [Fimbriimonadaceae bacterium]